MQIIEIRSPEQIEQASRTFLNLVEGHKIFAFYGPMGSGKTTLIKAICKVLGATDVITSPTFALVNEYRTNRGEVIYHLDLYRINNINEMFDLGYEEYFQGDHYIFIEWPERAESLLPASAIRVTLEETGINSRLVKIAL
jgi:tRNA threonylcarbamoyladenosine biosynthesis protein TsaE